MLDHIDSKPGCRAIAAGAALLLILLFSAACFAETITLGESSQQSTVYAAIGDELKITLSGNPTTSYIWEKVKSSKKIIRQDGDYQYTPNSNLLGAGGIFIFSFKAVASGTTKLRLIYHRPFEKNVRPSRTYDLTVIVK
jgi:inhibitor of cysteine peptidase